MFKNLLFDLDGTLAEWRVGVPLEIVARPYYFRTLRPMEKMCAAVEKLIEKGFKVGILSSVLHEMAIEDKNHWINSIFGKQTIPQENRFYVPYGSSKIEYIKNNCPDWENSVLIDDFTFNLNEWDEAGWTAIKCYNGINGTHGSWQGYSIHANAKAEKIACQIQGIIMAESAN